MALEPNTLLGDKYIVKCQIGQGSFSRVYIGYEDTDSMRLVAIKTEEHKQDDNHN